MTKSGCRVGVNGNLRNLAVGQSVGAPYLIGAFAVAEGSVRTLQIAQRDKTLENDCIGVSRCRPGW
jgi:hypothetical protein